MPRRYPLEPLRSLRQRQITERAAALGRQVESAAQAERAVGAARSAHAMAQQSLRQALRTERKQLAAGRLRAGDLQRAAEYQRGAERRAAGLSAAAAEAETRAAHQRDEVAAARRALGRARNAAEIVDEHRTAWRRTEARRSERREEEAALEARPRKGSR